MNTPSLLPPDPAEIRRRRAQDFAEVLHVIALAAGDGDVEKIARRRGSTDRVLRAATAAIGIGDAEANVLYSSMAGAWVASLAEDCAFDRLLPAMMPATILQRWSVSSVAITAEQVGEGAALPAVDLRLSAIAAIEPRRVGAIVAVTNEILRLTPNAAPLLDREFRQAVAAATDRVFLAAMLASTTNAPIASTGSKADIAALLAAVPLKAGSAPYFVFEPGAAKALATQRGTNDQLLWPQMGVKGGAIAGIPAIVTDGLASGDAVLIDAAAVAGVGGEIAVEASSEAALVLDSAPSMQSRGGSPSAPTPAQLVSAFQTNSTALRGQRQSWGFALLRPDAVASLSGVSYAG